MTTSISVSAGANGATITSANGTVVLNPGESRSLAAYDGNPITITDGVEANGGATQGDSGGGGHGEPGGGKP